MIPDWQQWLIIGAAFSWLVPAGIILKRLGYSPAFVAIAIIPLFALIGIWVLAFLKWPITRSDGPAVASQDVA